MATGAQTRRLGPHVFTVPSSIGPQHYGKPSSLLSIPSFLPFWDRSLPQSQECAMHTHSPIHSFSSHWYENSASSQIVFQRQNMSSLEERDSFPGLELKKEFVINARTQRALKSMSDAPRTSPVHSVKFSLPTTCSEPRLWETAGHCKGFAGPGEGHTVCLWFGFIQKKNWVDS